MPFWCVSLTTVPDSGQEREGTKPAREEKLPRNKSNRGAGQEEARATVRESKRRSGALQSRFSVPTDASL
nr:hypothetical protein NMY22_g13502 [Coprinellus aureogranulatus]